MGSDWLVMSGKERVRLAAMEQVSSGGATLLAASVRMGVSYRQAKRIWRCWRSDGAGGLIHGLRGRVSNRRLDAGFRGRVLALYEERYKGFGPTLASEKLAEAHGLTVSVETLRRWLGQERLWVSGRSERAHRRRRERRAQFGALVQLDGSHHAWFEDRAGPCCLMVMVDDATGETMAHMAEEETTEAAYTVLKQWIERHGVMAAIYTDRKSVFYTAREPTPEEKRQGSGALTEFGRACWRLGIEMIWAHSAQAKGRVERKNGVFQDRLVKELRLRGIEDIAATNAMLGGFCQGLNDRFARPAASPLDAHRHAPDAQTLNEVFCHEATRVVQNDWTVRFDNAVYQIEPHPALPRPGQRVVLRRCFDGVLALVHDNQPLAFRKIGLYDNSVVTPPLGVGPATTSPHPKANRGQFYWGQKGGQFYWGLTRPDNRLAHLYKFLV